MRAPLGTGLQPTAFEGHRKLPSEKKNCVAPTSVLLRYRPFLASAAHIGCFIFYFLFFFFFCALSVLFCICPLFSYSPVGCQLRREREIWSPRQEAAVSITPPQYGSW
jgi:hypothetical protein